MSPEETVEPAAGGSESEIGQRLEAKDNQIREAAKWLVASFAAVGAALIAGSQLSSIGELPVCRPDSIECSRLWIAMAGAVASLLGVVWAVWTGVGLLAPLRLQLSDLKKQWRPGTPIFDYFQANQSQLQGFANPEDMEAQIIEASATFDRLNAELAASEGARREALDKELDDADLLFKDILGRSDDVVTIANHVEYVHFFRGRALMRLFAAAAIAAVGIVAFAWAANPAESPNSAALRGADLSGANLAGVNLRNADLTDAILDGADLTGADLAGAALTGASLDEVVWSGTVCPDGTNSDAAGGSCQNHLQVDSSSSEASE